MSPMVADRSHRTGSLYGALAYGSIVLTCFAGFLARTQYYQSERMVPVVFALGAVYVALGILSGSVLAGRGRWALAVYYALQSALLTGIVFLSPIRGFMGLIVLPLMSQAVFDLRPRGAVAVGLYLLGLDIAIWIFPYGWSGALQAFFNYFAAFAFTIAFTIITGRALGAREREEKLREEVEAVNRQLREHAAQAQELATAQERNRVAREIHDGVGHYLTVVKTQLDAAAGLLPAQPERARDAVVKAAKLTGDALDDVRRSVGTLRTDGVRPPLPEALRALALEAGLPVTVRIEGKTRRLSSGVEHALFRSAQEGLTNVRKHAAASAAEVALDFRAPDRVKLAVSDNGCGGAGAGGIAGYGLTGICERIELIGGRVTAGHQAGSGFALTIEVPA